MYKKVKRNLGILVLTFFSFLTLMPVIYIILCSFLNDSNISFASYYSIFLATPGYLLKFWKSILMSSFIALGQTAISCTAAYAFSKYCIKGSKLILGIMILFMILPIQSTLLPNYIFLEKLSLLNTWWALILPSVFSPLGTVWLTFIFKYVPDSILDAAKVDGANVIQIICKVLIPTVKAPIITIFLLSFVESWNMVEQSIIFLYDTWKYPISVFLTVINENSISDQAVCSILCSLPTIGLFLYYHEEFSEGISDIVMER